jgi:hypothetical protein
MDRFPTDKIPTMGVCRSGNVFRLGYNPDFVADKDLPTLLCCLKHEAIHVAFNVFTMFSTEPSCPAEQQLRNMAADMEANSYIDWSQARGVSPVFARDFGWDNCLGTIEYYNRLTQLNQQQQPQPQPTAPTADDPMAKLQKLKQMLDMGLISQQDFDAKKQDIINSI